MSDTFTLPCYKGREGSATFRQRTLEEVLAITESHIWIRSNAGDAIRVKVNGAIKRWKREPERFEMPVKYGLYECARLDNSDLWRFIVPV